jgi:hypothetical protein
VSVVRFGRVEDGNSNGSSVFELLGVCFANSVVGMRDLTPASQNADPETLSAPHGLGFGRGGFEPPLTGPEPVVLPLDDLPEFEEDLTQSVVGRQDPFADPLCGSLQWAHD